MKPQPINNNVTFGIYKSMNITGYGKCTKGIYKGYNIEIYDSPRDKAKLYYISDSNRNWIGYKLVYIVDNIKRITRSWNNGMQR